MTDRIFYTAADAPQNSGARKITGYVPSKFLVRNGAYVVDPVPGASQNANLYSDSQGSNKTDGKIANPNNYVVVPANYSEEQEGFCRPPRRSRAARTASFACVDEIRVLAGRIRGASTQSAMGHSTRFICQGLYQRGIRSFRICNR